MTELHRHRDTSLHDIGGHLCVQRGPRAIRTVVQSFNELLEIAAEEIPLDNKDLDALGRFFVAGEPRPRSVGPHFIAAAFFEDGQPDPVGRRRGLVGVAVSQALHALLQARGDAHLEAFRVNDRAGFGHTGKGCDSGDRVNPEAGLPDIDPAQARCRMASDIERWVNRTWWPNDRSAEAVRELAHAVRRNDVAAFVDGEGCARYDHDEGDRKAARWKKTDLLNRIDRVCQTIKKRTYTDNDTADMMEDLLRNELDEALGNG